MAATRELAEIRAEIYQRGDLRTNRHPPEEMDRQINQSIRKLWRMLVEANPDLYMDSEDISVVSGTGDYSLADDYFKSLGFDVQEGSTFHKLPKFNWSERNRYQSSSSTKRNTAYRVQGTKLRLRPTPSWDGTVRHWYIPLPEVLVEDGDTFDGIAGLEEFVILDCVLKCKVRDEEDISEVAAQRQELINEITEGTMEQDEGEPDRVRDVDLEVLQEGEFYG